MDLSFSTTAVQLEFSHIGIGFKKEVPRKRWNLRNLYNLEQIRMIKAKDSWENERQ